MDADSLAVTVAFDGTAPVSAEDESAALWYGKLKLRKVQEGTETYFYAELPPGFAHTIGSGLGEMPKGLVAEITSVLAAKNDVLESEIAHLRQQIAVKDQRIDRLMDQCKDLQEAMTNVVTTVMQRSG